ncbi:hypothetical protein [Kitasatospora kifunensis]|uniref:Septum formation-related domain-containing protein n=1 Tax=Kitasatospora kifunensis TaxID=58351 RepID=A0A7W7R109_KITKI|nr:hypothetical protein [Kitasatospora kifunensis]MBB4922796.1 hypothetical protein [Kitasatospora kifunensis]
MTQSARRTGPLLALAVVLLLTAGAVTAALLWPATKHPAAKAPPPSPSPSASPSPSPSPSPSKALPYPWFAVGSCLDHPQLSPVITTAQARPCDQPHDAEAIANPTLPDGLTKESQIALTMLKVCRPAVDDWKAKQGGGTWYSFPLGLSLNYYDQGFREVTCLLTASQREGGPKLTGPLKS